MKTLIGWLIGLSIVSLVGCTSPDHAITLEASESPVVIPTAAPTSAPSPTISPTVVPECAETTGTITQDTFNSTLASAVIHYRIYLPPCYKANGKRYPLLMMLHGWIENSTAMHDDQWVRLGLTDAADQGITQGTLAPLIIVMPNGNDANQGNDGSPYAAIIATELLPEVMSRFCTWDDPARRAIGGLSRGGFWAFSTAFHYPNLFSRIGGHSPFLYSGDFKENNPFDLLNTPIDIGMPVVAIDHGAQDFVQADVQVFVQKLQKRGVDVTYTVQPQGSHVEEYWGAHVAEYLAFYEADWPLDVSTFPDC